MFKQVTVQLPDGRRANASLTISDMPGCCGAKVLSFPGIHISRGALRARERNILFRILVSEVMSNIGARTLIATDNYHYGVSDAERGRSNAYALMKANRFRISKPHLNGVHNSYVVTGILGWTEKKRYIPPKGYKVLR